MYHFIEVRLVNGGMATIDISKIAICMELAPPPGSGDPTWTHLVFFDGSQLNVRESYDDFKASHLGIVIIH